ncbi:MAG: hydrogen peroxide-inducible genes activator [Flammeovirgaceae bacterium]
MTLQQLEYIVALHTYRSFEKAASMLGVAQPQIMVEVAKIEDELGVKIFDNSQKHLIITEIGEALIDQARSALTHAYKVKDLVSEYHHELKGVLKVGVNPTISNYLFPRFLGEFGIKYPQIVLEIVELPTEKIIEDLKKGDLDTGIFATPVIASGLITTPIYYESFRLLVPKDHILYKQPTVKTSDVIINELCLLSDINCFKNQVFDLCKHGQREDLIQNLYYKSNSLESMMMLVKCGRGVTVLPELAALQLNDEDKNMAKAFSDSNAVREISISMHKSYFKKRFIDRLVKEIKNSLPETMKDASGKEILNTGIYTS